MKEEAQPGSETGKPPVAVKEKPQEKTKPVTAGTKSSGKTDAEDKSGKTASSPENDNTPKKESPPNQQQKSGGGGCAATTLALLALALSLGVGGAGYYLWQQVQVSQQQTAQQLEQTVANRVGEVGATLQENKQKFASVEEEITTLKSGFDALRKQQQELRTLQHDTTLQELAALNEKITTINSNMDSAEQRLAELLTQQQNITSRMDEANSTLQKLATIEETITTLNDKVEAASQRQQELLSSLEAAQIRAEQERHAWKLTEAEYLLKVAVRRLSLEQDISGAAAALKAADRNLAETENPNWLPVRKAISAAISELNSLPRPDIEGGAITIASLEKNIDQLPLPKPERHLQSTTLDTSALSQPEDLQSWGGQVWDEIKKLVVIRRGDKPATIALMPPDQAHYLRQNLHLKLENARYALLRNNPKLFKEELRTAQEWIETHFDTEAAATKNMLESLQKLQEMEFSQTLPDISAPLEQLRKLRNHKFPQQQETPDAAEEGASS